MKAAETNLCLQIYFNLSPSFIHHMFNCVGSCMSAKWAKTEVPTKFYFTLVCTRCLCLNHQTALEHPAVSGPGEGRRSLEKSAGWTVKLTAHIFHSSCSSMGRVGSQQGLSNFSLNWRQRWLAMATTTCSLMHLLFSESWRPHGWFLAALWVHCSPAKIQTHKNIAIHKDAIILISDPFRVLWHIF